MEFLFGVKIEFSYALLLFSTLFIYLCHIFWYTPKKIRSALRRQGIDGPPGYFLIGNLLEVKFQTEPTKVNVPLNEFSAHNCVPMLYPFFNRWCEQYGPTFMFSLGCFQFLFISQPDAVKEFSLNTSPNLGVPSILQNEVRPLLGQGILTSNGAEWEIFRKMIAPQLHMDMVKGMVNLIVDCTNELINSWEKKIEISEGGMADIKVDEYLRRFSGDVISKACFGSSYLKGKEIFTKIRSLEDAFNSTRIVVSGIPGSRHFPNKRNREMWKLEKEIHSLILKIVNERKKAPYEEDLLQMIIDGVENGNIDPKVREQYIVDNCKNIYLAGYGATALTASWALMLLAANPEWQARVRSEVLNVCNRQMPDADMLLKMKLLTNVIHETLRLYPPAPLIAREAYEDIKLGRIHIPKGVNIWASVMLLHYDPENWGPDADKFNPERFADGVSGACKFPHLYMPFGMGPRLCLGKNFAMVELKILLALVISNFSFTLSPSYCHSPVVRMLIRPGNEVNLLMRKLSSA